MSVQWCAGFEAGDANELVGVAGSVSVLEAAARSGRYGVRIAPPTGGDSAYITLANTLSSYGRPSTIARSVYVLGFAFKVVTPPALPGREYLLYLANNTAHRASLRLGPDGRLGLHVGDAASPPVATFGAVAMGRWHYCELAVLPDSYVWRMDGSLVATGAASPGGTMNRAYLGKRFDLGGQGYVLDVDDICTDYEPVFLGPTTRVIRLNPNADGDRGSWTWHGIGVDAIWPYVDDVPHDDDASYVAGTSSSFGVGFPGLVLAAGERIAAVAAAIVWRAAPDGNASAFVQVGDAVEQTNALYVSSDYDTTFAMSRTVPGTTRPWRKADVDGALAGVIAYSGSEVRCTQAGLHVLLHTPAVAPTFRRKDTPMNFIAMEPLVANGSDQPVEVPRGATLLVHPLAASVEVRHQAGATAKLTITADSLVPLGPSLGQTVHLRAVAGTTIELALT